MVERKHKIVERNAKIVDWRHLHFGKFYIILADRKGSTSFWEAIRLHYIRENPQTNAGITLSGVQIYLSQFYDI